jgi:hypothetical protein
MQAAREYNSLRSLMFTDKLKAHTYSTRLDEESNVNMLGGIKL